MNLEQPSKNLAEKKLPLEKGIEKIEANPKDLKRLDMWEKVAAREKLAEEVRDSKILKPKNSENDPYHLEETKALDKARVEKWKEVAVKKSQQK